MINRREFLKMTSSSLAMVPLAAPIALAADDSKQMLTRPIPSSGEALPVLGFGQSTAFRNGDLALSSELLDILIEMGGRFVDTSGAGQQVMGQFMRQRKAHDQLFLGSNVFSSDKHEMLNEIKQAQAAQGKGTLDLVQMRSLEDLDRQWQNLLDSKEAGLTRHVGFATAREAYYEPLMALMKTGTVDFIQVNYSMLEPGSAERVLPLAHDKGVAVVINRPFINGKYFSVVSGQDLPEWAGEFDCHSWAQFSLKYILANRAVNCVLTETSKTKHAVDNLSAGFGRLPDEATRQKMADLVTSFRPESG
jgi:diketogulonate reductase-like aldo/keto reductase